VPGRLAPRPVLAPAGHPAIDQRRVARPAVVGTEAEPLDDARAHALDEHVGALDQIQHGGHRVGLLQVQCDARTTARQHVLLARTEGPAAGPLDPDHVGAEVGQDHARVRARADAGDLDDPDPPERTGALTEFVRHAEIMTPVLSRSRAMVSA
jgi:hypothetical protein